MYNQNGNYFMSHQGFSNRYNHNTQDIAYSLNRLNRHPCQYSVSSYPPPPVVQVPSYSTTGVPMFVSNIPYDNLGPNHGTVHYDVSSYQHSTSDYLPTVSHFSNGSSSTNVSVNYQQNLSGLPCSSHQQDRFEPFPKAPHHQSGKVKPVVVVKEQCNASEVQEEIESVPSHKCESDSVSKRSITESNNKRNVSEGENFHGSTFAFAELTACERDSKIPDKRNMLCNNKELVHWSEIDKSNKSENFNEEHIHTRHKSKILSTISNTQVNTCNIQDYYTQKFQQPALQNNQFLNKNLPNAPQVQFSYPFAQNEYSSSDNLSSNLITPPALDNSVDSEIITDQLFVHTSKDLQTQIPSNHRYKESKIDGIGKISEKFTKLAVGETDLTSSTSRTPYAMYSSSNSVKQRWNENAQYDQNSHRRRISNKMTKLVSYNTRHADQSTSPSANHMGTTDKTEHPPRRCPSLTESSFDQSKQAFKNSSHSQINLNSANERSTISSNSSDAFYKLELFNDPFLISKESLSEMALNQEIISNDLKRNKRPSKTENSISYTTLHQDIENISSSEINSMSSEIETGSSNISQGTYRQASFKQSSLNILLDESKFRIHSYINDTSHT